MVEYNTRIIAPSRRAQRPLLPYGNTVDLGAMAGDFADGVTTISRNTVSEAFFATANCYDSLRVSIPSQVIDAAANDMVITLCTTFSDAIPNSYASRDISTGNIVTRWGEACNCRLRGMCGILRANGGVVN